MGVDALSYNLEVFDAEILRRRCVGRAHYIGRERYLEGLARAAEIFPGGTVWTDLVIGIEPTESTLAGIDALTALRVVPVVGLCAGQEPPDESVIPTVLSHLSGAVRSHNIRIGWVRDLARGHQPARGRAVRRPARRLARLEPHPLAPRRDGRAQTSLASAAGCASVPRTRRPARTTSSPGGGGLGRTRMRNFGWQSRRATAITHRSFCQTTLGSD
jgi:hypothetical protein